MEKAKQPDHCSLFTNHQIFLSVTSVVKILTLSVLIRVIRGISVLFFSSTHDSRLTTHG